MLASELQNSFRKASWFYRMVSHSLKGYYFIDHYLCLGDAKMKCAVDIQQSMYNNILEQFHTLHFCGNVCVLQVNSVPVDSRQEQHEMAQVLSEAFEVVRAELSSLPQSSPPSPSGGPAAGGSLCTVGCRPVGPVEPGTGRLASGEERTLALLEQYSELLLQAVEKRLDNKQLS